jgi:hypothetical protein
MQLIGFVIRNLSRCTVGHMIVSLDNVYRNLSRCTVGHMNVRLDNVYRNYLVVNHLLWFNCFFYYSSDRLESCVTDVRRNRPNTPWTGTENM